jgi:hypothetical protein
MTEEALEARLRLIIKRVAARKITKARRRRSEEPSDDYGGVPETDAVLDELPDSLVG